MFALPPTWFWLHVDTNPKYFAGKSALIKVIDILIIAFGALMGFSRFYLGRHTLDQIFLGAMLGYISALFFRYYFKPYWFDPIFRTNPKPETAWESFWSVSMISALLLLKVWLIFMYVEYYVDIPESWAINIK